MHKNTILISSLAIALIFAIAGTASPLSTNNISTVIGNAQTDIHISSTLWQSCTSSTPPAPFDGCVNTDASQIKCGSTKSKLLASRAFAVLSCLAIGAAALLSVLRIKMGSLRGNQILMGIIIAGWFFSLIVWPVMIAMLTVGECGHHSALKLYPTLKFGAAPFLFLISWLATCVAMVLENKINRSHDAETYNAI